MANLLPTQTVGISLSGGEAPFVKIGSISIRLQRLKTESGKQTTLNNAVYLEAFGIEYEELCDSKGSYWSDPDMRNWAQRRCGRYRCVQDQLGLTAGGWLSGSLAITTAECPVRARIDMMIRHELPEVDPDEGSDVFAVRLSTNGLHLPFHSHKKAMLALALRGSFMCKTSDCVWLIPAQCAMWIPAGVLHGSEGSGNLDSCALFIDLPLIPPCVPTTCCALEVTPLFRELIVHCASLPATYELGTPHARLVAVILDQLAVARVGKLRLPMPKDPRLCKIVDEMIAEPAAHLTLEQWAAKVAMGERTLRRLLLKETGMNLVRWRQQLHILLAIRYLSMGKTVKYTATVLGYEGTSAFISMFKRILKEPPQRYVSTWTRQHQQGRLLRC